MFSFLRSTISKVRQEARTRASQAGSSTTGLTLGHRASQRQYARRSIQPGTGRYQQWAVSETPPSPTRMRSFLLDPLTKPASLRASPSRELPMDASPFERRLASNPYGNKHPLFWVRSEVFDSTGIFFFYPHAHDCLSIHLGDPCAAMPLY